ncbi:sulfotransferase family 2 domain-containing protein [Gracilibacillus salinarum]|uniref:Sulfotransferase family protein n=1 Tax=Gracilibacillus salinarum TaxID=2932255 RepID=A0ABY4GKL5_9BACI|nr:sulfotransferase family 2 domain-containing protein [Gracilibacillus salinarum]UOQ84738.1 sulfotransferase family protein [Gracilibacillus salinarum]
MKGELYKLNEDLIIFMHIPKTGGTTLNSIFRRQYEENQFYNHLLPDEMKSKYMELNELDKNNIKAVAGHYFYGIHAIFSRPFSYFTMLRDPVDRVVSLYYYYQSKPAVFPKFKDMTFEEFINKHSEAHNCQTKMIAGLSEPTIDLAKENLRTFSVIGLNERFDESLILMQKALGWNTLEYERLNITKKRPLKSKLSKEFISLIEDNNQLDIELYQYAQELFEQQLQNGLEKKDS